MSKKRNDATKDHQTGQPEALATFAAAARSTDKVSPNGGLAVTQDTKAIDDDLDAKHDAATRILRENATGQDESGMEAARALVDRARETKQSRTSR